MAAKMRGIGHEVMTEWLAQDVGQQTYRDLGDRLNDAIESEVSAMREEVERLRGIKSEAVKAFDIAARENERLCTALREIAKGEGRFNQDRLIHATNTVEDMIALAEAALPPAESQQEVTDGR